MGVGCRVCKHSGWLKIGGFGMGIERTQMLCMGLDMTSGRCRISAGTVASLTLTSPLHPPRNRTRFFHLSHSDYSG
jgi:hypothetical protein